MRFRFLLPLLVSPLLSACASSTWVSGAATYQTFVPAPGHSVHEVFAQRVLYCPVPGEPAAHGRGNRMLLSLGPGCDLDSNGEPGLCDLPTKNRGTVRVKVSRVEVIATKANPKIGLPLRITVNGTTEGGDYVQFRFEGSDRSDADRDDCIALVNRMGPSATRLFGSTDDP